MGNFSVFVIIDYLGAWVFVAVAVVGGFCFSSSKQCLPKLLDRGRGFGLVSEDVLPVGAADAANMDFVLFCQSVAVG